jgi:hypothetical protein
MRLKPTPLVLALVAAASTAFATALALAADVGVSVSVGQPGFYGRIDIGTFPHPVLIYPEPIVIHPVVGPVPRPIYLRVPPGHARDWRKHCAKYQACGQPVYFVQETWYHDVYLPRYRDPDYDQGERRGKGNEKGGGRGKGHGRD